MSKRWGIASAGRISHDFVTAIHSYPGNTVDVVAVAAGDHERAAKFAELHGIEHVFESFEAMARSDKIDVVYIGVIIRDHHKLVKLFLENGKHVLCEKPLCLNLKQVRSLVDLARQKNLFFMEAVWSRFLPSYLALEKELQSGKLGEILYVNVNFGLTIANEERMTKKSLGGSIALDMGVYTLQFAQLVFKDEPIKVSASGALNSEGCDESAGIVLEYTGGRRAVLSVHGRLRFDNFAEVVGTEGRVRLLDQFYCAEKLKKTDGTIEEHLLPKPVIPMNYENSSGLAYQAQEVRRCIDNGLIESPRMSHADSLLLAKLEDSVRAQIGVHFDADDHEY